MRELNLFFLEECRNWIHFSSVDLNCGLATHHMKSIKVLFAIHHKDISKQRMEPGTLSPVGVPEVWWEVAKGWGMVMDRLRSHLWDHCSFHRLLAKDIVLHPSYAMKDWHVIVEASSVFEGMFTTEWMGSRAFHCFDTWLKSSLTKARSAVTQYKV